MNWSESDLNNYLTRRGQLQVVTSEPVKIVQQKTKQPNKTELRFKMVYLELWKLTGEIDAYGEHESIRLDIGNGVRFSPDWPTWKDGRLSFYEVKGARIWEDAIVKLKTAARSYPYITFWLYQWKDNQWFEQKILP